MQSKQPTTRPVATDRMSVATHQQLEHRSGSGGGAGPAADGPSPSAGGRFLRRPGSWSPGWRSGPVWFRSVLFLGLLLFVQASWLRDSRGEPAGSGGATSGATSDAQLELLESRVLCEGCEPQQVQVELVFSQPVEPGDVLSALEIQPSVTLESRESTAQRRIQIFGNFADASRYELAFGGKICTPSGACLSEDKKITFLTGGGYPLVRMPTRNTVLPPGGKIPLRLQNVVSATVTLVALRPDDLALALSLVGAHRADSSPFDALPAALQKRARRLTIDASQLGPEGEAEIDPFEPTSGDQVLVLLEAKGAEAKVAVYQRADVGVLTKIGTESGLVWVTDTASGKPMRGAQVSFRHGASTTWRGTTGADGLVRLPGRAQLRRSKERGALLAIVQAGGKTFFSDTEWTDGLDPWMFDLPYYYYSGQEALRGMVTVERGIYRPGERVYVLGVLRRKQRTGRLVPPGGTAKLTLQDPDGNQLSERNVPLTAYGTLRSELELPPHATLGRYHLVLEKDDVRFYHGFEVGNFRAATFEIKLPQSGAAEIEGDDLVIPVEASYLSGSPVAGGQLEWSLSSRQHSPYFAGYESYNFRHEEYQSYGASLVDAGAVELDRRGRAVVRLPRSRLDKPSETDSGIEDLVFEATVMDAADNAISARTVQRLQRRDAFVGVGSDQWVVSPRQGWDPRVVALDGQGKPVVGKVLEVELQRTYYDSVAERGPHGIRYRTSREEQIVARRTVTSIGGPLTLHFDLPGGGDYELRVRVENEPYVVSRSVWAYGSDSVGPALNTPRIDLKLDRDGYEPGQTAQAAAAVPYPQSTALLTVERAGVMDARVVELTGSEGRLPVAVKEEYVPNAFVGIVVVPRGTQGALPVAGSPLRAGYAELRVSAAQRRLQVFVEPETDELRPGEQARVRVKVRDAQDRPVRAEVTLWAADEGVLMLTGYKTPDPFRPAYAPYELDVASATNLSRWTDYDPDAWLDGGGDSGGQGSALRSRFLNTAFFSRGVVTDASGEASVHFQLPDNVTRWRLMAVAADAGQRFGSGESAVRATKPLTVTPALPRFVTEGDLVDAGVVVNNQTGNTAKTAVSLAMVGARVLGQDQQEIVVPAGEQRQVRFPVVVESADEVVVRVLASSGKEQDGFELALPAQRSTITEREIVGEGSWQGRHQEYFEVPSGARRDTAELEVVVAPSLLASLAPGVESLLDYPHGCAEQKTSRLVPMVVLGDLIAALDIEGFDQDEHRRRLDDTLRELEKHQNEDDGGFGLWVTSDSDPFITAYVLFGWSIAREHGYRINEASFRDGIYYLQRRSRDDSLQEGYFSWDGRVLGAYLLAREGVNDNGLSKRLFEGRSELGEFEKSLLASTLALRQKQDPDNQARVTTVLDELGRATKSQGSKAWVEETRVPEYYEYGGTLRSTAGTVRALVAAGKVAEGETLVRGILDSRRSDGTWGTTTNNLWALLALSDYVAATKPGGGPASVDVQLNGSVVQQMALGSGSVAAKIRLPSSVLPAPGDQATVALVGPAGRSLEYAIRLVYSPRPGEQRKAQHGYQVEREVLDAETGKPVVEPRVGQMLRVRLSVTVDGERNQTALTDRLPAGLEPLNAMLATTTSQHQTQRNWRWRSKAVHDDRVSFFAYRLASGTYQAEYLARASRSGEFAWPAATVESMYQPDQFGRTAVEQTVVRR